MIKRVDALNQPFRFFVLRIATETVAAQLAAAGSCEGHTKNEPPRARNAMHGRREKNCVSHALSV